MLRALLAAGVHPAVLRAVQGRFLQHGADVLVPVRVHGLQVRRYALGQQQVIHLVRHEQLTGVRPQLVDGALDAFMALLGAIAQPHDPFPGTAQVIADLLEGLGGNIGRALVGGAAQRLQLVVVEGVEEELTGDGVAIVPVRELDQQAVVKVQHVAVIGEGVLVTAPAFHLAGIGEPAAGLSDQVEGDIGHRHLLFQGRRMTDPLGQTMSQHQCVVAQPQQVFHERFATIHLPASVFFTGRRPDAGSARPRSSTDYMFSTSSGTS